MSRFPHALPDSLATPDTVDFVDLASFPDLSTPSSFAEDAPPPPPPPPAIQARLGLRILAKLIDGTVAGVIYCLCTLLIEDWFTGFFLGGLLASAYMLLSDGLDRHGRSRRSYGKRVVGLSVARLDRAPVDWRTSAQRNWMFVIPFFVQAFTFDVPVLSWLLLLVALVVVGRELYGAASSAYGCRWGDEFADTEVLERAPASASQRTSAPFGGRLAANRQAVR